MKFLNNDQNILALVGPSGIGKTTLMAELINLAQNSGRPYASTGPDPTLACQPWYPIRSVVSQVLRMDDLKLSRMKEQAQKIGLGEEDFFGLAQLFGLRHDVEIPEYSVRIRETTASTTRALLHSYVSERGLVLFFDDINRFDGASRSFLTHLCSIIDQTRVKIVISCEMDNPLVKMADCMIKPGSITREGAEKLAGMILPAGDTSWSAIVGQVIEKAGGNPFHLIQAFRSLAEGGVDVDLTLPDLVSTRIGRLPSASLRLLQIISTLGLAAPREFVRQLYELTNADPFDIALKLLVRRNLLLPVTDDQLIVSHESIADTVRERMPANPRRELHRQIVELSENVTTDPIVLARHAYEAKMGEKAIDLLEQAGNLAEECLDDGGAALFFRRALHIARWQLLLETDDQRCLELSLKLVNSMRYSSDTLGVELTFKEALSCAANNPKFHTRFLLSWTEFELTRNHGQEALFSIQNAVRRAYAAGRAQLLAETYLNMTKVLSFLGNIGTAIDELEDGIMIATGGAGVDHQLPLTGLWRLYIELAQLHLRQKNRDLAMQAANNAHLSACREQSLLGEGRSGYLIGTLMDEMGRHDESLQHLSKALDIFIKLGDRRSVGETFLAMAGTPPNLRSDLARRAMDVFQQINWIEGILAVKRISSAQLNN